MAPINDLVPNCAEKLLGGFGQQHELLNVVGSSLVFEPRDELVPHATLLITGRDGQRAQQRARSESLHPDHSNECALGFKYPQLQTGDARKIIGREPGSLEKRPHSR